MTQEYTPVSWQDETTSQQGTLINAERLNQMQTAHHYADGLEETDTVPTADPGVAYHKIVYCTADNTLYRWDGTQWTADIDDPTRELLEEHLADHDNPHQVTKAQVGLGNADNTSDMDKPVSTATQNALNAKADNNKVVHNTGNEDVLGVKKHYSQILRSAGTLGEVFNYTVMGGTASGGEKMWEIKGESRADGTASIYLNSRKSDGTNETIVLGDGQGSSSNKVVTAGEMGIALATKADKATTLAGYGITDAYTKTEADTLLGAKADQATTYTKTEVNTALALKADKATTYTKTEADTLLGAKAPTTALTDGSVTKVGTSNVGDDTKPIKLVGGVPTAVADTLATQTYVGNALDNYATMVRTTGNQGIAGVKTFGSISGLRAITASGYNHIELGAGGSTQDLRARKYKVTDGEVDTSVYDDIFSIGTRYASSSGMSIAMFSAAPRTTLGDTTEAQTVVGLNLTANRGNTGDLFNIMQKSDGTSVRNYTAHFDGTQWYNTADTRGYNSGSAYASDVATIGTLDAYTPMVRTSGNQSIEGEKTFQSYMIGRVSGDPIGAVGGNLTGDANKYVIMATMNLVYNSAIKFGIYGCANNQNYFESEYVFACSRADSTPALYVTHKRSNSPNTAPKIYYTVDSNNVVTFYGKTVQYCSQNMYVIDYFSFGNKYNPTAANRIKIATNAGTEVTLPADAIEEVVLTERI